MALGEDVYCTVPPRPPPHRSAPANIVSQLVMTNSYLPGAAVLAHSLRDTRTAHKLACLITPESLRTETIAALQSLYDYVIPVARIGNPQPANLYLMNRPDLLYTFTKIALWRLTQFRRVVYIDSDVVALRAPDELFALPDAFAAAPDVGWPDAFNTGVMLLTPDLGEYDSLCTMAAAGDSFDGADQGLLNQYFEHRGWKRLSFGYNSTPSASYQYEPAYRYFKRDISLVHFIGNEKPWMQGREGSRGGKSGAWQELVGRWWGVFDRHFRGGQASGSVRAVRKEVRGEYEVDSKHNYAAAGYPVHAPTTTTTAPQQQQRQLQHPHQHAPPAPPPEAPLTDYRPRAEAPAQPTPQPVFSAPTMEWDATRAAPPPTSRPEATNFPTHESYEFNTDRELFVPPARYPEVPREHLWYEVPAVKAEPLGGSGGQKGGDGGEGKGVKGSEKEVLAPIFPWEERGERRKATRRFVDEEEKQQQPAPPEPELERDLLSGLDEMDEVQTPASSAAAAMAGGMGATVGGATPPWAAFASGAKNAWDEVEGIEDYVRRLTQYQRSRGNVQVLHPPPPPAQPTSTTTTTTTTTTATSTSSAPAAASDAQSTALSPATSSDQLEPAEFMARVKERRESMILTDFPSAAERPSLPVTPAPRRRSTFWGVERGVDGGEMPGAEGVPEQGDWDPSTQLEQLRRNSLLGPGDLKLPARKRKVIPDRRMPASSARIAEEVLAVGHVPVSAGAGAGAGTAEEGDEGVEEKEGVEAKGREVGVTFGEPNFSGGDGVGESAGGLVREEVVSPSDQAP
ncbi:hypothetical protein LTR08_003485 [Meristemomyces frigidus]|nr:hypothetical protein LTR08_003485 [Meristemomyces frigidus]